MATSAFSDLITVVWPLGGSRAIFLDTPSEDCDEGWREGVATCQGFPEILVVIQTGTNVLRLPRDLSNDTNWEHRSRTAQRF